jgi:hypothetical protein
MLGEVRDSSRNVPWALVYENQDARRQTPDARPKRRKSEGGSRKPIQAVFRLMKVLTARQLNRALLDRQMLLDRSTASIPRVLERMGGLQAQYAPAIYVGLWWASGESG